MTLRSRIIIYIAMSILTVVSMWTTYRSLYESVLPEPIVNIPLGNGATWSCSIFALGLSVAIGLMLYGLKLAIIDGHKRLNIPGVIGMIVIAFISITFNIDVFYRIANQDFFLQFSSDKVTSVYEDYLATTQGELTKKRTEILSKLASQEGELESEIRGLRTKPSGYGDLARSEDYQLTLMKKTSEVELQPIEEGIKVKEKADALLASAMPTTIDEVHKLQTDLRVILKDMSAASGVPLPKPVKLESPLFAVFEKLTTWRTVGFMEVFLVLVALFLDLGDIIGYALIPDRKTKPERPILAAFPSIGSPETISTPASFANDEKAFRSAQSGETPIGAVTVLPPDTETYEPRSRRSVHFGRR